MCSNFSPVEPHVSRMAGVGEGQKIARGRLATRFVDGSVQDKAMAEQRRYPDVEYRFRRKLNVPAVRTDNKLLLVFEGRLGVSAANPRKGPISGKSCAFQGVSVSRPSLDRVHRAADHLEGACWVELRLSRLGHMMVGVHHHLEAARRLDPLAVHSLPDRVHVRRAGLGNRLGSHPEADESCFHEIVRGPVSSIVEVGPHFHESIVLRRCDRLELVTGRHMSGELAGFRALQFTLADGEGHDCNHLGIYLLGCQFDVQVAICDLR